MAQWFETIAQKQLQPTWNTPVQGTADPLPQAATEGIGPITVALSHRTIADTYRGYLDLSVDGLSIGQTVLMERFLVDNSEGNINANAILMDSRLITDGYLPRLGGEPNYNETLDYVEVDFEAVTRLDGQIASYFPVRGGLEAIPGEYVYRVSSPSNSFAAKAVQLTITQETTGQSFAGRVLSGTTPVPGALVGLLQSVGAYSHLRQVARADEDGNYRMYAPFTDEFELVAIAPGFVGPFWVGTDQVIAAGQTVNRDLQLTQGTRTLAGTVVDSVSDQPIAGLPVTFITVNEDGKPNGQRCTQTWTDANGAYSVAVTAERWGIVFKPSEVSSRSYLTGADTVTQTVDVTAGDATDVRVALTKGTSLIWGTLKNGIGQVLEGVEVFAINQELNLTASAATYEDGTFFLAVPTGHWTVFPFSYDLELLEEPGSFNKSVHISGEDQSVEIELISRPMGGVLEGRITDHQTNPVGKLKLVAYNAAEGFRDYVIQTTYASDGYFNFYLSPGVWQVFPDSDEAATRGLLFASLPTVVVPATGDPFTANRSSTNFMTIEPSGTVEVTVIDSMTGNPVPGIKVHGTSAAGQHAFARTHENTGVAALPVVDGEWEIHLNSDQLRREGKSEVPVFTLTVSGPISVVQLTAASFADTEFRLDNVNVNANGDFRLTGSGEAGQRYEVQGSRNLQDWVHLGRVIAVDGRFEVIDKPGQALPTSGASRSVFYRVVREGGGN